MAGSGGPPAGAPRGKQDRGNDEEATTTNRAQARPAAAQRLFDFGRAKGSLDMATFGFGIVGTGMIAGVIAEAIGKAKKARLTAVSSRQLANAENFAAKYSGTPVEGVEALLARSDVDAVYVATPTVAKEKIALAAIAAGKHVLVDKPFDGRASAARMIEPPGPKAWSSWTQRISFTIRAPRQSSKRPPSGSARPARCTPVFIFRSTTTTTSASIQSKNRPAR
jgi:hypothetical protein